LPTVTIVESLQIAATFEGHFKRLRNPLVGLVYGSQIVDGERNMGGCGVGAFVNDAAAFGPEVLDQLDDPPVARVEVGHTKLDRIEPEQLEALASKLIWTSEYAQSRLGWKQRDPLWVLVLRVHRLLEPITVPWSDAYGGCTSWVDLEGLPDDPESVPSELALSDVAFEGRLKGILEALPALAPVG